LTEREKKHLGEKAIAALNIERGRQDVARQDYRLAEEELSAENKALVLREPQLDTYWVIATVPLSKLRRISFPDAPGGKGSPVRIHNRAAWAEGTFRRGRVDTLVGALEEETRLARVLVTVPDPLAIREKSSDKPPLMIGAFVEALIEGDKIENVVRLERDYVREGDTLWVMKDGKLEIREVEVVFRDAKYAYIEKGVNESDLVVTTNLSTVTQGAELRRREAERLPEEKPEQGSRDQ